MDWPSHSDDFGLINYKSLESALVHFPSASFSIHILGPQAVNYYKFASLFSKHTFQKYIKYGYDLNVYVVDNIWKFHYNQSTPSPASKAWQYTQRAMARCCTHKRVRDIHAGMRPPFHLLFLNRVVTLLHHGGIFLDFSWIHLSRGFHDRVSQSLAGKGGPEGVFLRSLCNVTASTSKNGKHFKEKRCITSGLMAFQRNSSILRCIYEFYDGVRDLPLETSYTGSPARTESRFLACIEDDYAMEGAACIESAVLLCFAFHKTENALATLPSFSLHSGINGINGIESINGINGIKIINGINGSFEVPLWLGRRAYEDTWKKPDAALHRIFEESGLNGVPRYRNGSNNRAVHKCWARAEREDASCSPFNTSSWASTSPQQRWQGEASCAPKFVLAG